MKSWIKAIFWIAVGGVLMLFLVHYTTFGRHLLQHQITIR